MLKLELMKKIYENGEYWIDAKIRVDENISNAFDTIKITSLPEEMKLMNIPEKQIIIVISAIIIIGTAGLFIRK